MVVSSKSIRYCEQAFRLLEEEGILIVCTDKTLMRLSCKGDTVCVQGLHKDKVVDKIRISQKIMNRVYRPVLCRRMSLPGRAPVALP